MNERLGRILVVEDRVQWREVLSKNLQRAGFQVDTAAATEEVRDRLAQNFYHLIILDIRLDEVDQTNEEGMTLLQELNTILGTSVTFVMLSGYGTKEQMRAAFRDYKVADFLEKQTFDNRVFRQQVQELFAKKIPINLDLDIFWQAIAGPEDVVVDLKVGPNRVQPNTPLQARIATELDDLLCRLFDTATNLIVKPLTPGYSGSGVLWVQPFFEEGGGGEATVVKFGDANKIDKEFRNFEAYIRPFVGGGHHTAAINLSRTAQLGGIVYSLLGTTGEQEDFGTFYHRAEVSDIKNVLDKLFWDVCKAWYANPGQLQPHNLVTDYEQALGFSWDRLERVLAREVKSVQVKDRLTFDNLNDDRLFINPLTTRVSNIVFPIYTCITHGDLHQHNILIDQGRQVWLIDFQHTSPGHILRDVTNLDAVIRFQLLLPEDATLAERLAMEEELSEIKTFDQIEQATVDFSTDNSALAKAYELSVHLRTIARKLIAQSMNNDFDEYHIASFYHALNHIRFRSLQPEQREHALLSACLLAERLGL